MTAQLEWLIKWPDREELWKTMPNSFRACYGVKAVAIVDCYKIKIETPSHLVAKSSTWSSYKHANTAKVFIAMCPQGVTTFLSPSMSLDHWIEWLRAPVSIGHIGHSSTTNMLVNILQFTKNAAVIPDFIMKYNIDMQMFLNHDDVIII